MGLSASQGRFLSVTARLSDITFQGHMISEARIRLATETEGVATKYTNALSDRRLYVDSFQKNGTQVSELISYKNLKDQGLFIINGDNLIGFGENSIITGQEDYISGYQNNLNKPTKWGKTLSTIGQENDYSQPITYSKKLVNDYSKPTAWQKKTEFDYTKPTEWAQKEVAGATHEAVTKTIDKITMTDCQSISQTRGNSDETVQNLQAVLDAASITNKDDAEIVKYTTAVRTSDGTYEAKEVTAIAIKTDDAIKKLNSSNAFNTPEGLKSNYLLLADVYLNGENWNSIGSEDSPYTGMFDGNKCTISNMCIDLATQGNKMYQGLFGNNDGTVKGVNLEDVQIILDSAKGNTSWTGYVGGIAGLNSANGLIENCNVENITIAIEDNAEEVGGVIGRNYGKADKISSSGSITVGNYCGDVGGLIGWHQSGAVTRSSADVDINIGGNCSYGGLLFGDTGGTIQNCFVTGSLNASGTKRYYEKEGLSGLMRKGVENCFYSDGSSYSVYDDNSTESTKYNSASDFASKFSDKITVNGVEIPIWIFPGEEGNSGNIPILNQAAVDVVTITPAYTEENTMVNDYSNPTNWETIEVDDLTKPIAWEQMEVDDETSPVAWEQKDILGLVDDYSKPIEWEQEAIYSKRDIYEKELAMAKTVENLTSEEIEYGLRNGYLQLCKTANSLSKNIKTVGGYEFEIVDWNTSTEISDKLYTDNDAKAEAEYEASLKKIQTKDKKLEIEQQNLDTEYKALSTEYDSIKKVIDKNIDNSFKIFG